MRMTMQPAKVFAGVWQDFLAKRQDELERKREKLRDERERKRLEHADKIKHALIVLEAMRGWQFEDSESRA
jgi:hypothetical protein